MNDGQEIIPVAESSTTSIAPSKEEIRQALTQVEKKFEAYEKNPSDRPQETLYAYLLAKNSLTWWEAFFKKKWDNETDAENAIQSSLKLRNIYKQFISLDLEASLLAPVYQLLDDKPSSNVATPKKPTSRDFDFISQMTPLILEPNSTLAFNLLQLTKIIRHGMDEILNISQDRWMALLKEKLSLSPSNEAFLSAMLDSCFNVLGRVRFSDFLRQLIQRQKTVLLTEQEVVGLLIAHLTTQEFVNICAAINLPDSSKTCYAYMTKIFPAELLQEAAMLDTNDLWLHKLYGVLFALNPQHEEIDPAIFDLQGRRGSLISLPKNCRLFKESWEFTEKVKLLTDLKKKQLPEKLSILQDDVYAENVLAAASSQYSSSYDDILLLLLAQHTSAPCLPDYLQRHLKMRCHPQYLHYGAPSALLKKAFFTYLHLHSLDLNRGDLSALQTAKQEYEAEWYRELARAKQQASTRGFWASFSYGTYFNKPANDFQPNPLQKTWLDTIDNYGPILALNATQLENHAEVRGDWHKMADVEIDYEIKEVVAYRKSLIPARVKMDVAGQRLWNLVTEDPSSTFIDSALAACKRYTDGNLWAISVFFNRSPVSKEFMTEIHSYLENIKNRNEPFSPSEVLAEISYRMLQRQHLNVNGRAAGILRVMMRQLALLVQQELAARPDSSHTHATTSPYSSSSMTLSAGE